MRAIHFLILYLIGGAESFLFSSLWRAISWGKFWGTVDSTSSTTWGAPTTTRSTTTIETTTEIQTTSTTWGAPTTSRRTTTTTVKLTSTTWDAPTTSRRTTTTTAEPPTTIIDLLSSTWGAGTTNRSTTTSSTQPPTTTIDASSSAWGAGTTSRHTTTSSTEPPTTTESDLRPKKLEEGMKLEEHMSPPPEIMDFVIFIRKNVGTGGESFFCTGALVDPRIVLILRDCIRGFTRGSVTVTLPQPSGYKIRRAAEVQANDDIALLMLTEQFDLSDGETDYIPIGTHTDWLQWDNCKVYQINKDGIIRSTNIDIRTSQSCNNKYTPLKFICTESKIDICYDERGALLVCNSRLVGIRTETPRCTTFARYHNLIPLGKWILSHIPYRYDNDVLLKRSRGPRQKLRSAAPIPESFDDYYADDLVGFNYADTVQHHVIIVIVFACFNTYVLLM